MTIPNFYKCSSCREEFGFKVRAAYCYTGTAPFEKRVEYSDLLPIPVRPAWCKDCEAVCVVEDIAPLRAFEDAYGAVRCGREIEYPFSSESCDSKALLENVEGLLRWRVARIHGARALCCGRSNYQFMDVAQPLFKHDGCEHGFIEPVSWMGPYNGPGEGVHSSADIHVYDDEGVLIGKLTWNNRANQSWAVELAGYENAVDE
jgi:hypothetical protein